MFVANGRLQCALRACVATRARSALVCTSDVVVLRKTTRVQAPVRIGARRVDDVLIIVPRKVGSVPRKRRNSSTRANRARPKRTPRCDPSHGALDLSAGIARRPTRARLGRIIHELKTNCNWNWRGTTQRTNRLFTGTVDRCSSHVRAMRLGGALAAELGAKCRHCRRIWRGVLPFGTKRTHDQPGSVRKASQRALRFNATFTKMTARAGLHGR